MISINAGADESESVIKAMIDADDDKGRFESSESSTVDFPCTKPSSGCIPYEKLYKSRNKMGRWKNIGGDSERPSVQLLCGSHPVVSTKTVNDVDGNANKSISMSNVIVRS